MDRNRPVTGKGDREMHQNDGKKLRQNGGGPYLQTILQSSKNENEEEVFFRFLN